MKVELYSSTQDFVRAALEVAFILNLIASIRQEIVDLIDEDASERMRRLFSAGSMIDAVNFAVSAGQVVFWVDLVFGALHVFEIEPRYVVYKDLRSKARFFKVDGEQGPCCPHWTDTPPRPPSSASARHRSLSGASGLLY